jgi:hypothetical protein
MRQAIEVTNGRAVLDAADLRLRQSEPLTDDRLRYAVLAIRREIVRVLPIRPRDLADVLRRERVAELFGLPEVGW